jgi:hypothetical protein
MASLSTLAHCQVNRKFYKLLIIGNPQPTILHIPNRNNGLIAFYALVVKEKEASGSAAGVYLPEGRHPIIPIFQHSNCERSELSSSFFNQKLKKEADYTIIVYDELIDMKEVKCKP